LWPGAEVTPTNQKTTSPSGPTIISFAVGWNEKGNDGPERDVDFGRRDFLLISHWIRPRDSSGEIKRKKTVEKQKKSDGHGKDINLGRRHLLVHKYTWHNKGRADSFQV
jgi:hypothetical protein